MTNPTFNNKPNVPHTLSDGRIVWESRSVSVIAALVATLPNGVEKILLCRRGPGCPSEIGKWCMPCGYLDFNESLVEGAKREVFEEAGINLDDGWKLFSEMPWRINDKNDNVSLSFLFTGEFRELPNPTNIHSEPNEVTEYKWVDLLDIYNLSPDSVEFAFNHHIAIKDLIKYINGNRI